MMGRRRDGSESRLHECAVDTDHRVILVAGPIFADARVSYVTPSLRRETVYATKAALSVTTTGYCGAENGTGHPCKERVLL